jgi:hypothetical protein
MPGQFKREVVGVFTIVVNNDRGWVQAGGETRDMTPEELNPHSAEMYVGWISTLLPLKDKKFKLATLGEAKVKDRPVVGVRVSSEGHKDVNLFFDKDSSLLAKIEHRAIATEQGGKEVTQETFLSEYKEVDGVKAAHKVIMTRDGEKFIESETTEIHLVGKLDNSEFAKP